MQDLLRGVPQRPDLLERGVRSDQWTGRNLTAPIWITKNASICSKDNLTGGNENGILVTEDLWRGGLTFATVYPTSTVDIHDNDIQMIRGITGMRIEGGDATGYWRGNHVVFSHNTYRLDPARDRFLGPGNTNYTFREWQGLGNDRNSVLRPVGTLGSLGGAATPFVMSDYGAQGD